MWALQLLKALPHTQAPFDLGDTTSWAGRYRYSHFMEGETEAPKGSVLGHRICNSHSESKP